LTPAVAQPPSPKVTAAVAAAMSALLFIVVLLRQR
jgi:hypothetical protein